MNQIKLVIWDLDETFWKGTLSEGEIVPIQENIEMVKTLTKRGIINSISSKNDYEPAKEKLQELGVWEYFVFPIINWNPKGENVKNIISQCQLRSPNVLFIDDNPTNLKEVEHYNPEIQTLNAIELDGLIDDEGLKGKDDSKLSRLKQYKILEEKAVFKTSCSDNRDFLLKSNIRVSFIDDIESNKTRIAELIARSNQLNFTKVRIGEEELSELAKNPTIDVAAIHVMDNFGDYGICGFYALDTVQNRLLHYLFSCRILNLGIESYVYQKLGCPEISVQEPVSSKLDGNSKIDWITESGETKTPTETVVSSSRKQRLMLVGGCDMDQLCHYIDKSKFEVITDFNYVNDLGNPVHREHTCFVRMYGNISDEILNELAKLPFLDNKIMNYNLFSKEYDVLLFSVLMNYTQVLYRHIEKGFVVAYGAYNNILEMEEVKGFTMEQLSYFKEHYEYVGPQTKAEFRADLEYILGLTKKPVYFINGSEVSLVGSYEVGATERHREMNKVLDDFIAEHLDRCQLVDVRKFVQEPKDVEDNIRHYNRIVYVKLAEEIMRLSGENSLSLTNRMSAYFAPYCEKLEDIFSRYLHSAKKKYRRLFQK